MKRPFRFGVTMVQFSSGEAWRARCRRAEELGYDALYTADHLGRPAPFSTLTAAAAVTTRVRLGTLTLNAGFWNPALLAREVATCDQLVGGRLELGLGAGYVQDEHDRAGLPFGTARERVDHLAATVEELQRLLSDPAHEPRPAQRPVPLIIGGNGKRMLRLSAQHAHTAAFTGARQTPGEPAGTLELISPTELGERVALYEEFAADRAEPAERNMLIQRVEVTEDRAAAAAGFAEHAPGMSTDELLAHPALLVGTVQEIADQLRSHRERFGFTSFSVLDPYLEDFAPVIAELRGG